MKTLHSGNTEFTDVSSPFMTAQFGNGRRILEMNRVRCNNGQVICILSTADQFPVIKSFLFFFKATVTLNFVCERTGISAFDRDVIGFELLEEKNHQL